METVILVVSNKTNQHNKYKYGGAVIFWLIVGFIIYKRWKNKKLKK